MLDAARRKEYAQLINDSGQHLLSVVNGILDMSKMESGNFEISPEPFAPRAALMQLLQSAGAEGAGERHRSRHRRAAGSAGHDRRSARVQADRAQPRLQRHQVHRARRQVTVSAAVEGSRLVLRVTDTGVGIAADDLKRIGDPFFQAGKTYQRRHEGTGLGLSIVKSLVGLHSGELTCKAGSTRAPPSPSRCRLPSCRRCGSREQDRDADAGAAIRIQDQLKSCPSGEEKCLDECMTMTRAAPPPPWREGRGDRSGGQSAVL